MIKIFSRTVFITALILICAAMFSAQTKKNSRGERLLTALINSKTLPGNFGDDGVFFTGTGMTNGEISPDVTQFLKLGKRAIPLLIRHLDDKRLFKNLTFCCLANQKKPRKVTVGEVAFDILTIIVRNNSPMFDLRCVEEQATEDRCVAEGFYVGKTGRRNWQKAFRAGRIRYKKRDDGRGQ